jgi:hypothetical protein
MEIHVYSSDISPVNLYFNERQAVKVMLILYFTVCGIFSNMLSPNMISNIIISILYLCGGWVRVCRSVKVYIHAHSHTRTHIHRHIMIFVDYY